VGFYKVKIEAGAAKSIRDAARQIAEETGETPEGVRKTIERSSDKAGQPVPKSQPPETTKKIPAQGAHETQNRNPPETKEETPKSNEIKQAKDGRICPWSIPRRFRPGGAA
jgi:predicted transcriptional regulator